MPASPKTRIHGYELADFFAQFDIANWIMGPNLKHMRTDSASLANNLPVSDDRELGIIAGARFDDNAANPIIEGDNDGFLSVGVTLLDCEDDFVVLPEGHMFIVHKRETKKNVVSFLKSGRFLEGL
ncbi:MAG: hypothetical protein GF418_13720 [Chitinivibrionales bacterium]|nr:hypothetical protein [Chitinivibrionales bacterium]MBD3396679.1 hypothetical protein [Chitinivibrionales bacterium]